VSLNLNPNPNFQSRLIR